MNKKRFIVAWKKTFNTIKVVVPIIVGVLLFISFFNPILQRFYPALFSGNLIFDSLIGSLLGSVSFGIPITSYIAGSELLCSGVSLVAVTAFILAWTTVGVMMLPLEIAYFGKRFALVRNGVNFVGAILIAILTVVTLGVFGL